VAIGVSKQRRLIALGALIVATVLPAAAHADSRESVENYQHSWVNTALDLQYDLTSDTPLRNTHIVGTHNSFNSRTEMGPALSAFDSNQKLTLLEQLRVDVRSLELDVHWVPRPLQPGGFAPVVCHATPEHAGCTIEKTLRPVLDQIGDWLRRPANEDVVLLLYLEDHLDNQTGYDTAARIVEDELGRQLYEPPGGGCTQLPLGLTRDDVRAASAQVVVVSRCGVGSAWPSVAFDWSQTHEEQRPRGYTDYPDCGPDFTRAQYDGTLIRYFEDSTRLTGTVGEPDDGITPRTAAHMSRCGVDLFGLDQLLPFDGRLQNLVWSWAPEHPRGGARDCALQRVDAASRFGRWFSRSCDLHQPVACRDGDQWLVSGTPVRAAGAGASCAALGAEHAVPRTGYEVQLLREAMEAEGVVRAWIGYRRQGGSWVPLDPR
jgi:hypothetical protein